MTGDPFRLKRPCTHCPFRSDATRLRFAARERAEEIEESAYRNGFPCHETALHIEDDVFGDGGFFFGPDSQHCAGYSIMRLKESEDGAWPGILNDGDVVERLGNHLDFSAPVFETVEQFFEANEGNQSAH